MSIRKLASGRYEVRWREGSRHRARTFDRRMDAERWETHIRRLRQLGALRSLIGGDRTLSVFAGEWFRRHAERLSRKTRRDYASVWDAHVDPYLGALKLKEIRPALLEDWQERRLATGAGVAAMRKATGLVRRVLAYAVRVEAISSSPAAELRPPGTEARRHVRVLPPRDVEVLRTRLLEDGRIGDATLVSVLAYAGLRPAEALGLTWAQVGRRSLRIDQRNVLGDVEPSTKTRANRSVRLLGPLATDLAEWRMALGRPAQDELVFPRAKDGRPWTRTDYGNWRRRIWQKIADPGVRIYDLRHSFASLLIWEGSPVTEVASQLGHSAVMCLGTYAHVFAEAPERGVSAEDLIASARREVRAEYVKEKGARRAP